MPKVKVHKVKTSSSGVDIKGMMETVFSSSSRVMDLDVILTKYSKYKEQFNIVRDCLWTITEIIRVYEPASDIIFRAFSEGYDKHFRFTNESPETEEDKDMFYENYDAFKESKMCTYLARIAGKIKRSGIGSKWDDVQKMAVSGLLTLDIFNKVIDDVSAPYNLATYYHSNMSIPKDVLKKNRDDMTECLKQLLNSGKEIYKLMKNPDIPVKLIFEKFRGCLGEYKKSVRGVDNLFSRIDESSSLFENNFMNYYKSMMKTGSPIVIFQDFLGDVVKQDGIRDRRLITESAKFLKALRNNINKNVPARHAGMVDKAKGMLDTVLSFISDNSELGENDALSESDIKKMIQELENKFGVTG